MLPLSKATFFHFQGKRAYDVLMFNNILYYFSPETRVEMFKRAAEQLATDGVLIVISPLPMGSTASDSLVLLTVS